MLLHHTIDEMRHYRILKVVLNTPGTGDDASLALFQHIAEECNRNVRMCFTEVEHSDSGVACHSCQHIIAIILCWIAGNCSRLKNG
jgi:hypothetical protein